MKLGPVIVLSALLVCLGGLTPAVSIADAPAPETEQFDFAQALLGRGLYDMAVAEYQKFITAYPQSAKVEDAALAIGESYFLAKDFPKATDAFRHFKETYPQSAKLPSAILGLGQIAIEQKDFDGAIKELTSIDAAKLPAGDMVQAFDFYIATAYRGKGDSASALDFFQKAAAVPGAAAQTPYAYSEISAIQLQNGKFPEAIDAAEKAVQATSQEPLRGHLIYKYAEAQFLSGNYAEAVNRFHQVMTQYPGEAMAKDALANALQAQWNLGHYDLILTEYQANSAMIKPEGAYFPIHYAAARADLELKKMDDALTLIDKMLAFPGLSDQDKRRALVLKADALIRQKKFTDGLAILEGPLPGSADDADQLAYLKGQAAVGAGDADKAFSLFQDVKTNHPGSPYFASAARGMAQAREKAGKFSEAADLYYEDYTHETDASIKNETLYKAVVNGSRAGSNDAAVVRAEEYLKAFPQGLHREECILMLADLYAKSHQSEKAVALVQDTLAHPDGLQRPDKLNFLLGYNLQLLGRTAEALAAYGKVTPNKDDPVYYASALKNSAVMTLDGKNDGQAAGYFDRMITELDKNGLDFKTYLWTARQYLKDAKFQDALRIIEKAEKNFAGQSPEAVAYVRAEAYRGLKDYDNALKSADAVLAIPKNAYAGAARVTKGLCLVELGKPDEARAEFLKALDENPDDAAVTVRSRFELGGIAASQKKPEEALKYYLLIGTIYQDDTWCPESLLRAGGILEGMNRKDEALKVYLDLLEKYKDTTVSAQAKTRITAIREQSR